ncbi:MAG: D-2-hydroxyacid dehydrogenase [Bacillota bacterium]|nr:D-2-hydroxyacid dehydrogenase [Bacillota bacterium]
MKILLDPRMITTKHADALRVAFPTVVFTEDPADAEGVDAVFCHPSFAVSAKLDRYPDLAWVQIMMAGYDTADVAYLLARRLAVTNMRDIFHISIAEDVFAKILVMNRAVRHDLEAMGSGKWEPIRHLPEIHGSTVGIVGAGSIGAAIATRMKAFGAKVVGYRRKNAPVDGFDKIVTGRDGLFELMSESDIVIVALPLKKETVGRIGRDELSAMKPDALFINVGRGETVDQDALVEILRAGRIRGAGLDVMTPEPLPPDHPLWKLQNVFITPHNASSSPFVWARIREVLHENIRRRLAGEPLVNMVDD